MNHFFSFVFCSVFSAFAVFFGVELFPTLSWWWMIVAALAWALLCWTISSVFGAWERDGMGWSVVGLAVAAGSAFGLYVMPYFFVAVHG